MGATKCPIEFNHSPCIEEIVMLGALALFLVLAAYARLTLRALGPATTDPLNFDQYLH